MRIMYRKLIYIIKNRRGKHVKNDEVKPNHQQKTKQACRKRNMLHILNEENIRFEKLTSFIFHSFDAKESWVKLGVELISIKKNVRKIERGRNKSKARKESRMYNVDSVV